MKALIPKMQLTFRKAHREDVAKLFAIYRPMIKDSAISFELTAPATAEFAERIKS